MTQIFGWLSTVCFILSPVFLALKIWQQGHCRYLAWIFIWPWAIGEVAAIVHTLINFGVILATWPIYINYLTNILALGIIIKYKVWERDSGY